MTQRHTDVHLTHFSASPHMGGVRTSSPRLIPEPAACCVPSKAPRLCLHEALPAGPCGVQAALSTLPGAASASFSLHAPVTGSSLPPEVDRCLLAPDPGSPPGTLTPSSLRTPRAAPCWPGRAHVLPAERTSCPGRSPLFISAQLGAQGQEGSPPLLAQNPAGQPQAGGDLPIPLLPPQTPASVHELSARSCCPRGIMSPHSDGGPCAGALSPGTPHRPQQGRAQGVPSDGFLEDLGSPPAELLAPAPTSAAQAPGTPAQPSHWEKTSCFLFVSVIGNPVVFPRRWRVGAPASWALPVLAGPAASRRNLITLFSWFRLCFLIKKMTPLGSGLEAL